VTEEDCTPDIEKRASGFLGGADAMLEFGHETSLADYRTNWMWSEKHFCGLKG
jgi:hypothetical protein